MWYGLRSISEVARSPDERANSHETSLLSECEVFLACRSRFGNDHSLMVLISSSWSSATANPVMFRSLNRRQHSANWKSRLDGTMCGCHRAIVWKPSEMIESDNIASGSMINFAYASVGPIPALKTSRSWIIIEGERRCANSNP
jgi:hypothetical protein